MAAADLKAPAAARDVSPAPRRRSLPGAMAALEAATSPTTRCSRRWASPASWSTAGRRRPSARWASCWASTARSRCTWMPACTAAPAPTSATTSSARSDPKNMPVARQDLMRSVYRRYFTLPGKLFPKLVGARDLTKEVLDEWYSYYNQCSECRRCSVFCPYGIDTAEVTMAAKEIMDSVGLGQKYSQRDHRQGAQDRQQPRPARARRWPTRWRASKRTSRKRPARTSAFRSTRRAPRCCWSRRRPTSSPSRTSTA